MMLSAAKASWLLRRIPSTCVPQIRRSLAVRYYQELSYESTGPIVGDVLRHRSCDDDTYDQYSATPLSSTTSPMVHVQMLYAPWNPADLNTVQGVYPIDKSPELASIRSSRRFERATVAGSEGIGRVAEVVDSPSSGSSSSASAFDDPASRGLHIGDYVTLGLPALGTMRSSFWVPPRMLLKIARGPELVDKCGSASAAVLFQIGGTALRMLRDFDPESPLVLQNAGNSAVGFLVSQLAAASNRTIISLIRRGSRSEAELQALRDHLTLHGKNAMVVVEEDLPDKASVAALKERLRSLDLPPPALALNAVGGASCDLLLKLLGPGGTLVTYGGMSRKPVTLSTSQLIFHDLKARGYWQSRWMSQHTVEEKTALVNELVDLVLEGKIVGPPVEVHPLKSFQQALAADAQQSTQAIRSKIVFACQE